VTLHSFTIVDLFGLDIDLLFIWPVRPGESTKSTTLDNKKGFVVFETRKELVNSFSFAVLSWLLCLVAEGLRMTGGYPSRSTSSMAFY